jgi:hypothetical protein
VINGISNLNINSLVLSGNSLFAGTSGGGVFLTSNNGTNWSPVINGITNLNINSLAVLGNNLFASTQGGGIYLSTNNGTSWTTANNGITNLNVLSLFTSGNTIFAGTQSGNVFVSTNSGSNWISKNENLNSAGNIQSFGVINNYILAGTQTGIWKRPLSEIVTGVNQIVISNPQDFKLFQNYPNPFNPNTSIKYQVSKSSDIKLIVYDIVGKEIKELVNENQSRGIYDVIFDGSNLSTGLYYYSLIVDGIRVDTKKIALIK